MSLLQAHQGYQPQCIYTRHISKSIKTGQEERQRKYLVSTRTPPTVRMFFGAAELELPIFPESVLAEVVALGGASCSGCLLFPLFVVCVLSGVIAGLEKDGMASSSNSSSSSVTQRSTESPSWCPNCLSYLRVCISVSPCSPYLTL